MIIDMLAFEERSKDVGHVKAHLETVETFWTRSGFSALHGTSASVPSGPDSLISPVNGTTSQVRLWILVKHPSSIIHLRQGLKGKIQRGSRQESIRDKYLE